jgi:acetyl esterase/lipase
MQRRRRPRAGGRSREARGRDRGRGAGEYSIYGRVSASPKAGERYTPVDSAPIFEDPKRYYTEEHQRLTRGKIAKIQSPILIVQGDVKTPLAVNDFNAAVLIPELHAARKAVEVITYPGEPHCFAMMSRPASAAAALKVFRDGDAFLRRHIVTQPKPIDPALITHVPLTSK